MHKLHTKKKAGIMLTDDAARDDRRPETAPLTSHTGLRWISMMPAEPSQASIFEFLAFGFAPPVSCTWVVPEAILKWWAFCPCGSDIGCSVSALSFAFAQRISVSAVSPEQIARPPAVSKPSRHLPGQGNWGNLHAALMHGTLF